MDISMNDIDSLTLEYFVNKNHISVLNKNEEIKSKTFEKEKKFYKKRIIDLTKNLFRDEIADSTLKNSFNTYIKTSINYLNFLDKREIIQGNKPEDEIKINNNLENKEYANSDFLLFKEKDTKKITLDNYIKKTNSKPSKLILPEKQNYNIKTKEYKTKGIKKKKNINNKYDEVKEK
jgi:hypothetical protein